MVIICFFEDFFRLFSRGGHFFNDKNVQLLPKNRKENDVKRPKGICPSCQLAFKSAPPILPPRLAGATNKSSRKPTLTLRSGLGMAR